MSHETNKLTENVFAYGTLRSDDCNHDVLRAIDHEFLGKGQIRGEILYAGSLPFLMEGLGLAEGEIYSTDADGLKFLDRFEGHPHFYQRRRVTTESGLPVWVYFGTGVQQLRQA